jgi:serine protease Do
VPGAIIDAVIDGSSAKSAGLQPGDEFLEIDGRAVKSPEDCTSILTRKWAGEKVRLKMRRGAEVLDIEAALGARD